MTLRTSRRRAMQAALITAAAVTLPRAAKPAAPTESGDATITAAQVQAALGRLDVLIEDGMTKTGVPGTAVAVVHNDTVVYERGFGVRELQNRAAPHFRTQAGVWKPGNLTNDDAAMPAGGVSSSRAASGGERPAA
jgi:CubicO group peptidase (beta-lactamase class C family)